MKNLENSVLTTEEFINAFGTDTQKKSYYKYRKLPSNTKKSLIKTAEQDYEMTIIKEGRKILYYIGSKRQIKKDREDKRILNGAWSIKYTMNLDIIVANNLNRINKNNNDHTINNWLRKFELINDSQFQLFKSKFNKDIRASHEEELFSSKIISLTEELLLTDYLNFLFNLRRNLMSSMERMEKIGLINITPIYNGVYVAEDILKKRNKIDESEPHANDYYAIDKKLFDELSNERKKLMENLQLTEYTINFYPNSTNVKQFYKKFKKIMRSDKYTVVTKNSEDDSERLYYLDHYFKSYKIDVKEENETVTKYIEKFNPEMYKTYMSMSKYSRFFYLQKNQREYLDNVQKELENYSTKVIQDKKRYISPELPVELEDEGIKLFIESGELTREDISKQMGQDRDELIGHKDRDYYLLFHDGGYGNKLLNLHRKYLTDFNNKEKEFSNR